MEARTVVFNSVLTGSRRLATAQLPLPAVHGFLRVASPTQLAFADYKGNHQVLSTGNLAANDRVALFLMDYPNREHLKILGHARLEDTRQHPELIAQLAEAQVHPIVERLFFIEVISFDWNCPKYITPRYTAPEVEKAVEPLRQRIAELEAQLKVQT
jgi:predicted pyridoxine 5'-phosphate oxidase superfamily flavin-nucleotide-binding protein